eukprot:350951-Chlamydomonas_euryale.AAC.6
MSESSWLLDASLLLLPPPSEWPELPPPSSSNSSLRNSSSSSEPASAMCTLPVGMADPTAAVCVCSVSHSSVLLMASKPLRTSPRSRLTCTAATGGPTPWRGSGAGNKRWQESLRRRRSAALCCVFSEESSVRGAAVSSGRFEGAQLPAPYGKCCPTHAHTGVPASTASCAHPLGLGDFGIQPA